MPAHILSFAHAGGRAAVGDPLSGRRRARVGASTYILINLKFNSNIYDFPIIFSEQFDCEVVYRFLAEQGYKS